MMYKCPYCDRVIEVAYNAKTCPRCDAAIVKEETPAQKPKRQAKPKPDKEG